MYKLNRYTFKIKIQKLQIKHLKKKLKNKNSLPANGQNSYSKN